MQLEGTRAVVLPEMVRVPSGVLVQKDDRKGVRWTSQIDAFEVSAFPVTQRQYLSVSGENPAQFKGDNLPVESVSWFDALRFCNGLSKRVGLVPCYSFVGEDGVEFTLEANGYRLLSDAEWEYACRAGSHAPRYGPLDAIAWHVGNSQGAPQPVRQKEPNAFGLYDMIGNVWEWCWDRYDPEVYGEYRVFKGGGWADDDRGCLATNRRRSHPSFRVDDLGFRVARSISS